MKIFTLIVGFYEMERVHGNKNILYLIFKIKKKISLKSVLFKDSDKFIIHFLYFHVFYIIYLFMCSKIKILLILYNYYLRNKSPKKRVIFQKMIYLFP